MVELTQDKLIQSEVTAPSSVLAYRIGTSTNQVESEEELRFIHVSNNEALPQTLQGKQNNSDLVSGVYEGGLKVWECSLDLVDFISTNQVKFQRKKVLEIGCGQGLPGVAALKTGALEVVFQDFNQEVLSNATSHVIKHNLGDLEVNMTYEMVSGSWEQLVNKSSLKEKFDVILMSETLYNVEYYTSLFDFIDYCLIKDQSSEVIVGTKTYYFGLGGGFYELEQFLKANKQKYNLNMKSLLAINDGNSIERQILSLTRNINEIDEEDMAVDN